jgi:hypothetical protein
MEPTYPKRSEVIRLLLTVFLVAITTAVYAQRKTSWDELSKVEWSVKYLEAIEDSIMYPSFAPAVMALQGVQVEVSGYIIPVDISQHIYVLSANPNASCFFCGFGGPESIVELQLVDRSAIYSVDELLTFKGALKLNWEDMMHFNYILENATKSK